jgi:hypothetical protein
MAIVLKDRVKETTTTTGTGSFTLAGAVGGFQSFAAVGNGNITYYAAVDPTTGDWEVGKGTYSTTGPTLTRDTVYESSAAGAKIGFGAGPKDVFVTYPAERAIYEEPNGNTLIDGGPLTIVGAGVTGYTSFSAVLAEMYADVDSFAQVYAQNLNDGSNASADFVAYNDLGDGVNNFVDMGINSSNYTSVDYPIFTPNSAYLFNDGGELFIGSATDDVVLFAGGTDVADEAVRIDKTTKALTAVGALNLGGALDVTGAAVFGSTVLLNADPTLALQAATKAYVDNATSNGFHVHTPVLVATTGNLTATYNQPGGAGVGVGATLTNSGTQVALSIDGVAMATNNRVLVWQQTSGLQNGIYVVTTVGSGSTNWVLTRSADADTSSEGDPNSIGGGDYFFVDSGATLGYHSYICVNTSTITFGTTSIDFNEFSSVPAYTGGTNITVDGQVINVSGTIAATLGGTGTSTVTTGDLLYGSGTNTWSKLAAGAGYKSLVMNAGGTNVEWNAVALNQSGAVSGALPATNGGTGQAAYAVGDTLYSGATNTLAKLAGNITTTKKFLGQTGTGSASQAPVWEQPAASDITGLAPSATTDTTNAANITSGTLPSARLNGGYTGITGVGTLTAGTWNGSTVAVAYGGTGQASYAVGDLLYADTTTSLAKLADVATGNALIAGGVGAAPSWGKIGLATHVSGTLPIANGGTNGSAVPTAGAVAFGTGTAYNFNSAGTSGQLLTSAGAGTPTWTTPSSLSVGTATNVAGGAANQVLYQSGSGATTFVTAPTTAGTSLTWNGSAFTWSTAGSATLQNDTSTNSTFYPTFATTTSGSFTDARVSSTKLTFNPNTGTLGATVFSGPLTGNASTASRVTGGNLNPASTAFNNALIAASGSNRVVTFDGNGSTPSVWWSNGTRAYGAIDAQDPGLTFWANNGSSWQQQMQLNYGNVTINTDIRSPIFYDSNNTGYYLDLASTSRTNYIWSGTGTFGANSTGTFGGNTSGLSGVSQVLEVRAAGAIPLMTWHYENIATRHIGLDSNGFLQLYNPSEAGGSVFQANNSLRAPIFYDSNDTQYYVDPNSTSVLSALRIVSNNGLQIVASNGAFQRADSRNESSDSRTHWYGITNGGGTSNFRHAWYDGAAYFNVTASGSIISFDRSGSGAVQSAGDFRAPIFYDSNDTGYYLDPNSTSQSALRIRGGALHGPNPTWGAYLLVGGDGRQGYVDNSSTASVCATNGNLHIDAASGFGTYINFYDGNIVSFGNGSESTVSTINPDGSHRAQIFYDYNNTGYYDDPSGRGSFNQAVFANGLAFGGAFVLSGSGATLDNSTGARMTENYGPLWNFSNGATWHHQIINGSSLVGFQANGGNFGNGNIFATGNITAYYSDERLKTKITAIENALAKVKSLEGFIYVENDLARSLGYTNNVEQAGLSAQRVKAVLPQAVSIAPFDMQGVSETGDVISKSGENYLTVDYSRVVPLLIEAIKELSAQVDDLQKGFKLWQSHTHGPSQA